ncbi:hypothetical protein TgHK011_006973 [Trichoderma gracile]|nr:hypothetical protein TgHK011_006973 [Trichoderma gracile]
MSGHHQPPPLPPRNASGNGPIPPPTPPRHTFGGNTQYPYETLNQQQTSSSYGYPAASSSQPTAAAIPYYPPPPGPPPPRHTGYPYASASATPSSVTPVQFYPPDPQSQSQAYYPPTAQNPSPYYPPPPQSQSHSYPPPPPLPARPVVQQTPKNYTSHAPYNPAQNHRHVPPAPAPYIPALHPPASVVPTQSSAHYSFPSATSLSPSLDVVSPQQLAPPGHYAPYGTGQSSFQQQPAYLVSQVPPPVPPPSTCPPIQNNSNSYYPPPKTAGLQSTVLAAAPPASTQHEYPKPPPPSETKNNQHQVSRRPVATPDAHQTAPAEEATPTSPPSSPTFSSHPAHSSPLQTINDAAIPAPPPLPEVRQHAPTQAQDSMAGLYTQMEKLNMDPTSLNAAPQLHLGGLDDDTPRPPPLIRASGAPLEVITYCPEARAVDYSLYWYRLPDNPDFLICTRCHADHIRATPLASHFEKIKRPDNFNSSCCFWFPRVKEVIWPEAVRSGRLEALRAFMKKRLDMKACKGRDLTPASDGIKWFGMAASEVNGFISCEACHEDRIIGTPFESRFSPYREQPTDEKWSCDLAVPYISRAIVKLAKRNDWATFVAEAARRLSLPKCEGQEIQSNHCTWYVPRQKIENMRACEACYLDRAGMTRFENEFEKYDMGTGFDAFFEHMTTLWSCKLCDSKYLNLIWAMENAIDQRNFSAFTTSAEVACRLPPCTVHGIVRGNWWTIQGGCDNFDVCESCFVSIVRTCGVSQFFEPAKRDPEATLICDFCVASPRFRQYLRKFAQSLDQGVFSYYMDYVRTFASVPVCPGLNTVEKGNWWGYPNALFCQDCYLSFVLDTKLGNAVVIKKGYDERAQICQIWSSRMRTMWLQVCDAGPPGSPESDAKLAEFVEFGAKRLKVYTQTVPQMKFIRDMKRLKMQNAMHQGLLSVMYNGMDGLASVSGAVDGNLHGNSQLGWYATEQGAQGAQMFNNMQAGFANANRMDEWMQIFQLEMIWKEVE